MAEDNQISRGVTGSTNPTADDEGAGTEPASFGSPFLDEIVKKITNFAQGSVDHAFVGVDMPTIAVPMEHVVAVCRFLRDAPDYRFKLLSDLTAVDHLDRSPRFDVVYHLYSLDHNTFLRVKTGVPEEPGVCPTMTGVWPGANWLEREVWDMFGITFDGHPHLDRILTPDGWQYFALRRDFPLQGPAMVKLYDKVTDVF